MNSLSLTVAGIALVSVFAAPVQAQVPNCFDSVLGIYDDPARSSTMGQSTPGTIKSVYLGIDFAAGETGLTAIEFSIAGVRFDVDAILLIATEWSPPPAVILGVSVSAPVDTTASSAGSGGVVVAWPLCLAGSRTLARIDLLHFAPVVDKVLQVKRRYPTTNSQWRTPVFVRCDSPNFTSVRLTGGCYILNWSGNPDVLACLDGPVGVEPRTWTGMKALYR